MLIRNVFIVPHTALVKVCFLYYWTQKKRTKMNSDCYSSYHS